MVDSWRVEEYDLYSFFFIGIDPRDTPLGRLRTMRYGTHFFSDKSIEEGGFSGIWATDDGDISDFRHMFYIIDFFDFIKKDLYSFRSLLPGGGRGFTP